MKWDEVTTNDFGTVLFWDGEKIVYSVHYQCFCCDWFHGNAGWIRGFSKKDGITKASEFCG